jgi:hypothetical protein
MASPPVQYEFAGQDTHILLVVLLHATVWYVPAAHVAAHVAMAAPPVQYELAGQVEHCRLVVLVHAVVS